MYEFNAEYVRTIDGDTIVCDIDAGFYITYRQAHIRLLHINCPEINKKQPGALEAKAFTKAWMETNPEFIIKTYKSDDFGRWLGEIYSTDGQYLNKLLLDNNLAVPFEG